MENSTIDMETITRPDMPQEYKDTIEAVNKLPKAQQLTVAYFAQGVIAASASRKKSRNGRNRNNDNACTV